MSARNSSTPPGASTGIAIIGCGYVADFYAATLGNHPLELRGVYDVRPAHAVRFSSRWGARVYPTLDALLADDSVAIVVNLTNPNSHFEVSRRCLEGGKHVYSEKPLALDFDQAVELVELAARLDRKLSSAPCGLLSETAQTMWHALDSGVVGRPLLVYADLDDGAVHQMPFRDWFSASGAPWPFVDEFRNGPTIEHAAYYLSWLTAFFGPARTVTSYSGLLVPSRLPGPGRAAPDFSCAIIEFRSGVVGRLTCGTVAPENHVLTIVGEDGVLSVDECWNFGAPVSVRTRAGGGQARHHYLTDAFDYPLVRPADYAHRYRDTHDMDFARGVADLADGIAGAHQHLTADHALHVLEIVLAIAGSEGPTITPVGTTFAPVEPMPWATLAGRAGAAAFPG